MVVRSLGLEDRVVVAIGVVDIPGSKVAMTL